jgi:SRSO17 transposase
VSKPTDHFRRAVEISERIAHGLKLPRREAARKIALTPPSGERKYYLSNLPADASLKTLAAAIKARWVCEQAHQQLKEELGLDHFEGRSWHGLHRHALMTMIAYAYLQTRRLAEASGGKKYPTGATAADVASNPASRARNPRPRPALSMPPLQANAA